MSQPVTLAMVLAHLKKHPPTFTDGLIAAKATEILRELGINGPRDTISRPLVNMLRHGKTNGASIHGTGVKGYAVFAALRRLKAIPGVPQEFLKWRAPLNHQRQTRENVHYRKLYYQLIEKLANGEVAKEVTIPMLTPKMLSFFGLDRNPVYDEIQSEADMWWSDQHKEAKRELIAAAIQARFVRLAGARGCGKSLVGEAVKKELRARTDVTLAEPSPVLAGVLSPTHLISAVIQAIKRRREEREEVFSESANPVKRALAMRALMIQERDANRRVVLLIDESHELRADTFKALKRFLDELHLGRRLIGVVLIGQHAEAFNPRAADLSEVTLRMQTFRIEKMNAEIPAYLRFKIERAGGKVSQIITPSGLKAIAERCPFPLDANALFAQLLIEGFREGQKPIGQDEV
jgi:type II secretory pathway predicted ATPase ExeA